MNMGYQEFMSEYNLYLKKEKEYAKSYVEENLNVGDKVEIMTPMLGNGQFGNIVEVRELPKKVWNVEKQTWNTKMVTRYIVVTEKGYQLQFAPNKLKKID